MNLFYLFYGLNDVLAIEYIRLNLFQITLNLVLEIIPSVYDRDIFRLRGPLTQAIHYKEFQIKLQKFVNKNHGCLVNVHYPSEIFLKNNVALILINQRSHLVDDQGQTKARFLP